MYFQQGISETQPLFPILKQDETDKDDRRATQKRSADSEFLHVPKVKVERSSPDLDQNMMPPPISVPSASEDSRRDGMPGSPQPGTSQDGDGNNEYVVILE